MGFLDGILISGIDMGAIIWLASLANKHNLISPNIHKVYLFFIGFVFGLAAAVIQLIIVAGLHDSVNGMPVGFKIEFDAMSALRNAFITGSLSGYFAYQYLTRGRSAVLGDEDKSDSETLAAKESSIETLAGNWGVNNNQLNPIGPMFSKILAGVLIFGVCLYGYYALSNKDYDDPAACVLANIDKAKVRQAAVIIRNYCERYKNEQELASCVLNNIERAYTDVSAVAVVRACQAQYTRVNRFGDAVNPFTLQ